MWVVLKTIESPDTIPCIVRSVHQDRRVQRPAGEHLVAPSAARLEEVFAQKPDVVRELLLGPTQRGAVVYDLREALHETGFLFSEDD